jgi:tight adherence protein C
LGYRAAAFYTALTYGALGLAGGSLFVLASELSPWIGLGIALLMTALGYVSPGGRLEAAVRERRHRMVIEMAFRLPEMAAIVSTGKSITQACRTMIERPGGPFITELARLLRVYDTTMSMALAVEAVVQHNHFAPLTEFFRQVLLVEQQGGAIGPTLQVQAEAAQNTLQRWLLEQGLQNAGIMELPVVAGSMVVTMILVGGPAVYLLLTYL